VNIDNEMIYFEMVYVRESERAILVEFKTEQVWLPKSKVIWQEVNPGQITEVQVPLWLARKNNMMVR